MSRINEVIRIARISMSNTLEALNDTASHLLIVVAPQRSTSPKHPGSSSGTIPVSEEMPFALTPERRFATFRLVVVVGYPL